MENNILKDIEILADLLFTKDEIIEMIGSSVSAYDIPAFNLAYQKGKYTRMVKLRKSLLQLADNGSHPALDKAFTLFDKQNAQDV